MVKEKVENETSHEKFKRLATKRTNKILHNLKILGNCSNRNSYDYSFEEVRKIFDAIDIEVKRIKTLFKGKKKARNEFKL